MASRTSTPSRPRPLLFGAVLVVTLFLIIQGVQAFSGPLPMTGWLYLGFAAFNVAALLVHYRTLRRAFRANQAEATEMDRLLENFGQSDPAS